MVKAVLKQKSKQEEDTTTRLSALINQAMEEKGVTIMDLADHLKLTYEHVRRLVRGTGAPSRWVLMLICDYLGIDKKLAERECTADKITRKFGTIPLELSGK